VKPGLLRQALYKGRARIEQAVGKLKRFKRVALRCENGELEPAALQHLLQHRPAAGLLPQPGEQQRRPDPLGRQLRPGLAILQSRQEHDLIAEAGAGGQERSQRALAGELIGPANRGDDILPRPAVLPAALDNLQVAARPGLLEAEIHAPLPERTA
jgi:hypothetical protein